MLLQFVLLIECGTVDTVQARLIGIASPVRHRRRKQLVGLHSLGAHQMRSCTQINESSLIIERDLCILRQILDQLYLVGLAFLLHKLDRIVS